MLIILLIPRLIVACMFARFEQFHENCYMHNCSIDRDYVYVLIEETYLCVITNENLSMAMSKYECTFCIAKVEYTISSVI